MIIQRWQSVLLFIAAAVMACFTFFSLGQITTTDITFNFMSLGFYPEGNPTDGSHPEVVHTWYFFMLNITCLVILLLDIFLYRNLNLQKRVCLIGLLFTVASACVAGCLGYTAVPGGYMGWSSVALCPFIAFVAIVLAYNRINADQRLLKAADRLR